MPMPQPYFVPVSCNRSRKAHSKGILPSASMVRREPFTTSENCAIFDPHERFSSLPSDNQPLCRESRCSCSQRLRGRSLAVNLDFQLVEHRFLRPVMG